MSEAAASSGTTADALGRVRRRPGLWTWAAVGLGTAAAACFLTATVEQTPPPPIPPASLLGTPAPAVAAPDPVPGPHAPAALPASPPTRVSIAAIGLDAAVRAEPLGADGDLPLPADPHTAAWSEDTPAPGEPGTSVIAGHVDTHHGPAAFYGLGAVRPGASIDVWRADHSVVRFTVDAVAVYPKDSFPAATVYAPSVTAGLRLLTCTGWDSHRHLYRENLVVYASLTRTSASDAASRPPRREPPVVPAAARRQERRST